MSFPLSYASPAVENLSIPPSLIGDDLRSFKGARKYIKSIPSSTSNVGPSSTVQFQIPTNNNDFIVPGSMVLRAKMVATAPGTPANTFATWKFAGQGLTAATDYGGFSSIISRANINLGGTVISYNNYNHMVNAVIKSHCLNPNYVNTELSMLEWAGIGKESAATTAFSAEELTLYAACPLFFPIFNSQQAFPLCLMNAPITIELLTETVTNAFAGTLVAVTSYTLSEISLNYEVVTVSPEFVSALRASKAGEAYNIRVNDFMSLNYTPSLVDRYQIGCGLSSLKSVLWSELSTNAVTALTSKQYSCNGLSRYTIYVDGQVVSPPNADNSAVAYSELNRALGRLNDPSIVSLMDRDLSVKAGQYRSTYNNINFLGGCSTQVINDMNYSQTGIPASTVTLELEHSSTVSPNQWENTPVYAASSNCFVFLLYDSLISIDVSTGIVSLRK